MNKFEQYVEAIKNEFENRGVTYPDFDPECWRDNFEDGDSPEYAVGEELSCWTE